MSSRRSSAPRVTLSALRLAGGAAFLLPRLGVRKLGLHDDAESAYLMRLFAARNLALTTGLVLSRGEARRLWWQAGIVCDLLDAGAGLLGLREGKERASAVVDTSASLVATGLGVAGLIVDRG
jgi:hypothetical protein